LAAALNDDSNFASTVIGLLDDKADIDSPSFTGTVDFSAATVSGVILPINWLGAYDNAESYAENDLVELEGSTYYATGPNLNYASGYAPAQPGSDWELFAAGAVAATIEVGAVTGGASTDPPVITNVGTNIAAVFDFTIPAGIQGIQGEAATIAVGSVSASNAGTQPTITNSGTAEDATFDFIIPQGLAGSATAGTTTTVPVGTPASVTNSGDTTNAVFDFTIPVGIQGEAATVAVGSVSTVPFSDPATVSNSGTTGDAVLDFEIPQGLAASISVGTVTSVTTGNPAEVSNSGTTGDAVFDFTIPAGLTGIQGPIGATGATGITWQGPWDASADYVNNDAVFYEAASWFASGDPVVGEIPDNASAHWYPLALQGAQGIQGEAATISVGTVTTGAPTDNVVVTNVGTTGSAVFDFVIPKGDTGNIGALQTTSPIDYDSASSTISLDYDSLVVDGGTSDVPQSSINLRRSTAAEWLSENPVLGLGEAAFESDTNKLKIGDGIDTWDLLSYASGGASVEVGDAPPSEVEPNTLWWNSDEGVLYIYYDNFWVEAVSVMVGPTGPQGKFLVSETAPNSPEPGDGWFNSTNARFFIYYDSYWVEAATNFKGAVGPEGAEGPAGADSTIEGPTGATGDTGPTGVAGAEGAPGTNGATGPAGVVAATLPVTYDAGTSTVGIDQTAIGITASQISDVTSTAAEINHTDGVTSNIQTQLDAKQDELTGLTSTVAELNFTDGVTSAIQTQLDAKQDELTGLTSTVAELNFTDGVTSAIQTQLDARVLETNGAVTTAATDQNVVRNITLSTADPTGGADGDVWLKYTA
jgi:hypothetical protein